MSDVATAPVKVAETPAIEPAAAPAAAKPRYDRSIVEEPLQPAV